MIPDSNIKKVIIPKSELPLVDGKTLKYNVRFRIVSEDKNRISHWSQMYDVSSLPVTPISDYAITTNNVTRVINLIWQSSTETSFDIYVKWVGQAGTEANYNYQYLTTTFNYSYSTIHPVNIVDPTISPQTDPVTLTDVKKVRFLVQRPTYPKEIFAPALLFETALTTI